MAPHIRAVDSATSPIKIPQMFAQEIFLPYHSRLEQEMGENTCWLQVVV